MSTPTTDEDERRKRYQWDGDSLAVVSEGKGKAVKIGGGKTDEAKKGQAKDEAIFSNSLDVMLDEE